jgi:hypothetical protein
MTAFLQSLILRDFWLKLFSFALASLVWFIVNMAIKKDISPGALALGPTEEVVFRDLPIVVLSPAQDVPSVSVSPKSATVTLQADKATMRKISNHDIRLLVDLSEDSFSKDGHRRIEVSTPAGISRVRVEPEEVQLTAVPKN